MEVTGAGPITAEAPALMASGNIAVYDLDAPVVGGFSGGAGPSPQDPNVMVYPLDGWDQRGLPGLPPPSGTGMGYSSPFMGGGTQGTTIYFRDGSSSLSPQDRRMVEGIAAGSGGAMLSVEGHASSGAGTGDPVQRRIVNLKASMDRAFSVSSQLIRDGVAPESIRTTAWGDTRPAGSDEQNRRVEIRPDLYGSGR